MTLVISVLMNVGKIMFSFLKLTIDCIPMRLDVFNTEGHPFNVPAGSPNAVYGTGNMHTSEQPFKTVSGNLPLVSVIPGVPGLVFGHADLATKLLTRAVGGIIG